MHRRLLEDRVEELKVGAVLLLKQVNLAPALSLKVIFTCCFEHVLASCVGRWVCFPPPIETIT